MESVKMKTSALVYGTVKTLGQLNWNSDRLIRSQKSSWGVSAPKLRLTARFEDPDHGCTELQYDLQVSPS